MPDQAIRPILFLHVPDEKHKGQFNFVELTDPTHDFHMLQTAVDYLVVLKKRAHNDAQPVETQTITEVLDLIAALNSNPHQNNRTELYNKIKELLTKEPKKATRSKLFFDAIYGIFIILNKYNLQFPELNEEKKQICCVLREEITRDNAFFLSTGRCISSEAMAGGHIARYLIKDPIDRTALNSRDIQRIKNLSAAKKIRDANKNIIGMSVHLCDIQFPLPIGNVTPGRDFSFVNNIAQDALDTQRIAQCINILTYILGIVIITYCIIHILPILLIKALLLSLPSWKTVSLILPALAITIIKTCIEIVEIIALLVAAPLQFILNILFVHHLLSESNSFFYATTQLAIILGSIVLSPLILCYKIYEACCKEGEELENQLISNSDPELELKLSTEERIIITMEMMMGSHHTKHKPDVSSLLPSTSSASSQPQFLNTTTRLLVLPEMAAAPAQAADNASSSNTSGSGNAQTNFSPALPHPLQKLDEIKPPTTQPGASLYCPQHR